jgi:hypothetical protein
MDSRQEATCSRSSTSAAFAMTGLMSCECVLVKRLVERSRNRGMMTRRKEVWKRGAGCCRQGRKQSTLQRSLRTLCVADLEGKLVVVQDTSLACCIPFELRLNFEPPGLHMVLLRNHRVREQAFFHVLTCWEYGCLQMSSMHCNPP